MTQPDAYYIGKGVASLGLCMAGGFCMYVTGSATGIGWICFGLFIIWGLH